MRPRYRAADRVAGGQSAVRGGDVAELRSAVTSPAVTNLDEHEHFVTLCHSSWSVPRG
jgi:hypothetical protein